LKQGELTPWFNLADCFGVLKISSFLYFDSLLDLLYLRKVFCT